MGVMVPGGVLAFDAGNAAALVVERFDGDEGFRHGRAAAFRVAEGGSL